MKIALAVVLAFAVVAMACGGQMPQAVAHVPAGQVYVTAPADQALWVVDSATGAVARSLPAGTPAPDWRALYRLANGALDTLDPTSGRVIASRPAPDWARVVRTSADGRWLVLSEGTPGGRFQVLDTTGKAQPITVALPGAFSYDGISGDGQRLYLLERLYADRYQVRMYDLRNAALAPYVIAEKGEVGPMSGTALTGYTTRGGAMQLTLYQRNQDGRAFVHALPIGQELQWAYCVDLPGPQDGWAFAAAPGGDRFYAVNADGRIVELRMVDAESPPDVRQRQDTGLAGGAPALAVSPDGRTLYVGTAHGVSAVDTGTLKTRASGLAGRAVTALAAAPAGDALYAVSAATRLARLDPRTLRVAGEVTARGGLGEILRTT
jgi:DNA-binding beta-propeller fold protein YncE